LPADHLRVENDCDFVPFLPPLGVHVGDKLWFVTNNSNDDTAPRFVANTPENQWTDSFWINFFGGAALEILTANGVPHRIPSYLQRLEAMKRTLEEEKVLSVASPPSSSSSAVDVN